MKKPEKLMAKWSKKEKDIMIYFPRTEDGHLLNDYLNYASYWSNGDQRPSMIRELEARGYDITTLKFSIERKKTS